MKKSVQAVIINKSNEILCVSRKDNHNDFGLPGGKVDIGDSTNEKALVREVMEETGLIVDESSLIQIFSMYSNNNMGYTYLIKEWSGKLNTVENHVVKWGRFGDIINGSFGEWNKMVMESINNMGITVK